MSRYTPYKIAPYIYRLDAQGPMRVPALIFADEELMAQMEDDVFRQLSNVATLPGIVMGAMAMPDAHLGYGFPIGGVGAFDPRKGGVVSAGGVGFDIACGVRTILTGITEEKVAAQKKLLADLLYQNIPAGMGTKKGLKISDKEMDRMLSQGALWAVSKGFGEKSDLEKAEEGGTASGADPQAVSSRARQRLDREVGTLGSGNHYLEVQAVREIYDPEAAEAFGLRKGDAVISIHCGSRGLGHQVATEYIRLMVDESASQKIHLPDRDLACAPILSSTGQSYLGAMRAAINCALANRQILTHLARETFSGVFPDARMPLLYDVCHNTCREEKHSLNGRNTTLFVHRKGATRAFGPGQQDLPPAYRGVGQPVLVGGSMGTSSYILAGTSEGMRSSLGSACHGAGRVMSRKQAIKKYPGRQVIDRLQKMNIEIRGHSFKGLAEEAPETYKEVDRVVDVSHNSGLARRVARLKPLICIKG